MIRSIFKRVFPAFLVGILVAQSMMYYNHYTYGYHVEEAWASLDKLEQMLDSSSGPPHFLASILGKDKDETAPSEEEIQSLTSRIVNLTEHAVENTDDLTRVKDLKKAVNDIIKLQESEIELIALALETVTTQEATTAVEADFMKANLLQDKVRQADSEIQAAIASHQETMSIEIETDKEQPAHETHAASGGSQKVIAHPTHTAEQAPETTQHKNPNLQRLEEQKQKDAEQREANRQRIKQLQQAHK